MKEKEEKEKSARNESSERKKNKVQGRMSRC
jgi:hypothetical protein